MILFHFIYVLINIPYCILPTLLPANHLLPACQPVTSPYSVLKLFTGFETAALIAWKLTVAKAINIDASPPVIKIHPLISILKG